MESKPTSSQIIGVTCVVLCVGLSYLVITKGQADMAREPRQSSYGPTWKRLRFIDEKAPDKNAAELTTRVSMPFTPSSRPWKVKWHTYPVRDLNGYIDIAVVHPQDMSRLKTAGSTWSNKPDSGEEEVDLSGTFQLVIQHSGCDFDVEVLEQ